MAEEFQKHTSKPLFSTISAIAEELEYEDFPKKEDIIAIVRIESNFIPAARNKTSIGVMQVNHGPRPIRENMEAGVKILREYYTLLGSTTAAVISYNIGIGNYVKRRSIHSGRKYFQDFQKYRRIYEKYFQQETQRLGSDPDSDIPAGAILSPHGELDGCSSGGVQYNDGASC